MAPKRTDAAGALTEQWNRRLAEAPDAEEQAAAFADALSATGLTYRGRPFCSVYRPRFLSESVFADLERESHLVMSALDRAEAAILADPDRWLPALGRFTEQERELLHLPVRLSRGDMSVRLDAVELPTGWRFFELNGAVPGGVEFSHELMHLFAATPIFAQMSRTFGIRPLDLRQAAVTSLLDAWTRWGGTGLPTVAIVDWMDDPPLLGEFRLLVQWLTEAGVPAFLADPRELEFRDGRLRHASGDVDLVYRRLVVADMIGRADECAALVAAARADAACFIDPIPQSTLDRKALFAFVTDPRLDPGLTADEAAACRRSIPWTRLLVPGVVTGPDGTDVDLLSYVRAHRDELVLKPNHDFGGHGIHLGWQYDEGDWDSAIEEALAGEWVAQRAEPRTFDEPYPTLAAPRDPVGFHASTDPFLFDGGVRGVLTRLAHRGATNVASGASAVPTFLVAD